MTGATISRWSSASLERCANGAPFLEMPEDFRRPQQHLLRPPGGDREMVENLALDAGAATKPHILNLLYRLVDGNPGSVLSRNQHSVVIARRWVVERTLAGIGQCRRMAKDCESGITSSEAWPLIASICRLCRRITRQSQNVAEF